jgi:hypothetical protein
MSKLKVPAILRAQIATFTERNRAYGDNWEALGALATLFPNGVKLRSPEDFIAWHLFEWAFGKLTRFARTGMTHKDSLHDAAVYLTLLEAYMEHLDVGKEHGSSRLSRKAKDNARMEKVGRSKTGSPNRRRKPQ